MPLAAFDPVRDAATRSPVTPSDPFAQDFSLSSPVSPTLARQQRPTHLSALLNADAEPPTTPRTSSSLARILNDSPPDNDDKLAKVSPIQRSHIPKYSEPGPSHQRHHQHYPSPVLSNTSASRPSSSSSSTLKSKTASISPNMPPPSTIPYNPTKRRTPAKSVLIPMTPDEMRAMKNFVGQGTARLSRKRKRDRSPGTEEGPPSKRFAGDVGLVVGHYNARPEVGIQQRQSSVIFGLKSFNNWVKSVLITRFAHPALQSSTHTAHRSKGKGKVLDMGCGKGGDLTKWAKAQVREVIGVDIAAVSVDQARTRWETMRGSRFDATFAALDCYTEPLSYAIPPDKLTVPFDVVSMQFCMHYAFETESKVRRMLENVSKWLRPGGVFVGTIPNAEQLLEHLDELPPDESEFGNSVYRIRFPDRQSRPLFGHKYFFYLKDAVDDVPEYIVHWDNFLEMAEEYGLQCIYREEFHKFFEDHQDHKDYATLLQRMNVVDANGESSMDEDQWEAANVYVAFAFQKM